MHYTVNSKCSDAASWSSHGWGPALGKAGELTRPDRWRSWLNGPRCFWVGHPVCLRQGWPYFIVVMQQFRYNLCPSSGIYWMVVHIDIMSKNGKWKCLKIIPTITHFSVGNGNFERLWVGCLAQATFDVFFQWLCLSVLSSSEDTF